MPVQCDLKNTCQGELLKGRGVKEGILSEGAKLPIVTLP
jgi:hypothetical protein